LRQTSTDATERADGTLVTVGRDDTAAADADGSFSRRLRNRETVLALW
jgi:hypothetical protein